MPDPPPPPQPPAPQQEEPQSWPAAAQWATAALLLVFLGLLGWRGWGLTRWSTRPLPLERESVIHPVDLNQADIVDLELIPGIGPELARRILAHRHKAGRFTSVDELLQVPGIGPSTLTKIHPHFAVYTDTGEPPPPRVVRGRAAGNDEEGPPVPGKKKKPPSVPLDLNRASAEQLQTLPGIGPTLAGRIVDYRRDNGGFRSVEDLRKVKGIGVKTMEKLRPHVRIDR